MGREDAAAGQDALVVMLTRARTETIRRRAIEGVVTLGSIDWPEDYRGAFLRSVAPGALEAALHHGVPASVTLAQAIQESGWGRSGLAREHHNLFGVKAGASSQAVVMPTVEVSGGRERHVRARFRTFDSPADSVAHHGALLSQDDRYGAAQVHRDSWRDFLDALAPVYASDPRYAQRVGWLIERYELDRWDRWVSELAPHDA
jgi:flagellum-specific peptidoglycan hydrolase FlgJ